MGHSRKTIWLICRKCTHSTSNACNKNLMVFIKISKISKFIFDAQFGHSVGSALAENIGNPIKTG